MRLRARAFGAVVVSCVWVLAPMGAGAEVIRGGRLPVPLPLLPPSNWWNLDISAAPVDAASSAYIAFIGPTRQLHPDFGGDSSPVPEIYGMPYVIVDSNQ